MSIYFQNYLTFLLVGIISLSIVFSWFFFWRTRNPLSDADILRLGSGSWYIEVADTPAKRARGLSYRNALASDKAMFFVFPKSGKYSFWMFGMRFPIDIIFLDDQMRVVDIFADVSPATFPNSFVPRSPAKYVLEINAGQVKKYEISKGDSAELK